MFSLRAQWKEELVVTGPGGSFTLAFWMGIPTVDFPTEERWAEVAPKWAQPHWHELKAELEDWCRFNNARLEINPMATIW